MGTGCDFSCTGAAAGASRTEPVHERRPVKAKKARVMVYVMSRIHVRKENASTASHSLQNLDTMPGLRLKVKQNARIRRRTIGVAATSSSEYQLVDVCSVCARGEPEDPEYGEPANLNGNERSEGASAKEIDDEP